MNVAALGLSFSAQKDVIGQQNCNGGVFAFAVCWIQNEEGGTFNNYKGTHSKLTDRPLIRHIGEKCAE